MDCERSKSALERFKGMVLDEKTTQPKMPRVSIGLPVYNGERYLKATLDSILAQTYTDFELIISDNASTDCTPSYLPHICRAGSADQVSSQRAEFGSGRKL